ncbi:SDR family oxidoreductase [Salicibibacter cibi]|uniref:SDR family oxidoreductase n=1 Tax=Salicibibacter cibi TaxID=2743001 RepID=A0A7T6Z8D0_9BACI|nr:SDR family oxidoreductase [Salicibibacter cibi]QQK78823.1 SDR family oxidoreductase [Salicibibacter cibi]
MGIEKRVALVTGGGTGLGKAITLHLARLGMDVAVNYSQSKKEAHETVDEVIKDGYEAMSVQADVSSSEQVYEMIEAVIQKFGRLDVVIANAGTTVFRPFDDLEGVSEDDWDRIMNVNVKGVWLTAKAAAPYLKARKIGRLIITSSIAGSRPTGSSLPYSVSKAAVNHLTKGLAKALGPEILVNAIAPGILDTRWTKGHSESMVQQFIKDSPLHKTPTIADCVKQVDTLVETDTMTGTITTIDSGASL